MAFVTGKLNDFGLDTLTAFHPEIVFTPSGPAIGPTVLFATRPIVAIPAADGTFSVDLSPTEDIRPDRWYAISIRWLDSAGGYIAVDFPDWQLRVPPAGGTLSDILNVPANPAQVWVFETPPANPTPGTWWLNPTTGDLNEWSN